MAARNILVDKGHVCKIADFGLARDIYEKKQYLKIGEVSPLHCHCSFTSYYNLKQQHPPFIHQFSPISCLTTRKWRVGVPLKCNVARCLILFTVTLFCRWLIFVPLYFQGELPLRWMAIESIFKGITTTKSDV